MFKPDEDFVQKIDTWIDDNKAAFVKDLSRLVAVPSISEKEEGKYPFGKNCGDVLDEMTSLASEYGFQIENHKYYCGSLLVKGEKQNPKKIGMYAHLDVVPLGEGWQYPPLECTRKDGFLIGRGVGDNKGPGVCALYALRFLKEHGIRLQNDVLIYYGCSEETGMQDIEYFCKTQQVPDFNLVVDTNFPVCYGEKGLMRAEISCQTEGNLLSLQAGSVVNVIPAKAEAVLSNVDFEEVKNTLSPFENICVEKDGGNVKISASGISKHAAFPEGSVNAIHVLAEALVKGGCLTGKDAEVMKAVEVMTADAYGNGCGIPFEDKESGKLTCVGSVIRIEEDCLSFQFDVRYPVTVDGDVVIREFTKKAKELGFDTKVRELSAPAYVPCDTPQIQALSEICDYVQGKHYEPYTMGGGTYARHLPNAVGFGPGVPDAPNPFQDGHGQGHQPDECIAEDILFRGIKTYIMALLKLDTML